MDHPILMLTKRPDRAAAYTNAPDVEARVERAARDFIQRERERCLISRKGLALLVGFTMPAWPLRSVALITSAGTQAGADARVPGLLRCKAAIRGVSCEPMTGRVDFSRWLSMLSWIILGGESGDISADEDRRPRPCELEWLEDVVSQCKAAHVPVFVKQLGHVLAVKLGRAGKGGELEDLPLSLRIREFPRLTTPA